jgi:hypothetical protein
LNPVQITPEWAGVFLAAFSAIAALFMWSMAKTINQGLLEHEIRMMNKFDQRFIQRGEFESLSGRVAHLEDRG